MIKAIVNQGTLYAITAIWQNEKLQVKGDSEAVQFFANILESSYSQLAYPLKIEKLAASDFRWFLTHSSDLISVTILEDTEPPSPQLDMSRIY